MLIGTGKACFVMHVFSNAGIRWPEGKAAESNLGSAVVQKLYRACKCPKQTNLTNAQEHVRRSLPFRQKPAVHMFGEREKQIRSRKPMAY